MSLLPSFAPMRAAFAAVAIFATVSAFAQDHSAASHPAHAHDAQRHAPPAQRAPVPAAARAQLAQVAKAVERYRDIEVAKREGWTRFGGDEPLMGEHWSPPQGGPQSRDYRGSDTDIDFSFPNNLMYTRIGDRTVLTGVAFIVRLRDGEAMPQGFAGDADRWHAHDMVRAIQAATEERPVLRWLANGWLDANYFDKGDDRGRLAMVHAWVTLPNPDGPFSDYNRVLAYRKLGLPDAHAEGASLSAARGLHLGTEQGCRDAVDGKLWIADASRNAAKRIRAACDAQARNVRAGIAAHRMHPDMLNRAGEEAWQAFDAVWSRELTGAQRARIAAMSDHGGH